MHAPDVQRCPLYSVQQRQAVIAHMCVCVTCVWERKHVCPYQSNFIRNSNSNGLTKTVPCKLSSIHIYMWLILSCVCGCVPSVSMYLFLDCSVGVYAIECIDMQICYSFLFMAFTSFHACVSLPNSLKKVPGWLQLEQLVVDQQVPLSLAWRIHAVYITPQEKCLSFIVMVWALDKERADLAAYCRPQLNVICGLTGF